MYINTYMLYIQRVKYWRLLPVLLINQNSQRNSKENIEPRLESSAHLSPLFPPATCELGYHFSIQSQSYIVITGADICSHFIHFLKIINVKQKVGFTQLILDLRWCSQGAGSFSSSSSPGFLPWVIQQRNTCITKVILQITLWSWLLWHIVCSFVLPIFSWNSCVWGTALDCLTLK